MSLKIGREKRIDKLFFVGSGCCPQSWSSVVSALSSALDSKYITRENANLVFAKLVAEARDLYFQANNPRENQPTRDRRSEQLKHILNQIYRVRKQIAEHLASDQICKAIQLDNNIIDKIRFKFFKDSVVETVTTEPPLI